MAWAHIEPVSAWMRIWDDDVAIYGDPFDFFIGVRWLTKDHVELCGMRTDGDKPFSMSHALAVRRVLASYGAKKYQFKRFKDGKERIVSGRVPDSTAPTPRRPLL